MLRRAKHGFFQQKGEDEVIKFTLRVNGKFKTENFMWYSEETAPRPKEVVDRGEALRLLDLVESNCFALRVITINTNTYDLTPVNMEPGGSFEVGVDPDAPVLVADVRGDFKLTVKDKQEEKDLRELFSSNKLSFHAMEVRITREGVETFFGPEGGKIAGGRWEDKTTWPAVEILETTLAKRK